MVDSNVLFSSLIGRGGGASRAIIQECLERRLNPLMGAALFAEYESLLGRKKLIEGSSLQHAEREAVMDAFLSVCRWVKIYFLWRPNLRDEADNHLIELAVAGGAETIITKNVRDFRDAELVFPALRILRPKELLSEMT